MARLVQWIGFSDPLDKGRLLVKQRKVVEQGRRIGILVQRRGVCRSENAFRWWRPQKMVLKGSGGQRLAG